ncbi:hypothetical protein F4778DRAFT_761342 [Xylariomycetidae sp. FL2044]|nr:hypothetical protein F4778DRAFT_761342 [Xylariomycetidae sp. FL2044]
MMWTSTLLRRLVPASIAAFLTFTSYAVAQDTPASNGTAATGPASSLFVTPARDLAFALNVPEDSSTDLFFSLMMPTQMTWGAIGLGSTTMSHALILMIYASSTGQNVTLSPRVSHGHSEPVYSSSIQVDALPGTGLINDTTYVYNGRCRNCRDWIAQSGGGGSFDVKSADQGFIYATGEAGEMQTDNQAADLRMHVNYGSFTMDMVRATGPNDGGVAPVIVTEEETQSVGTTLVMSKTGKRDSAATAHAVIMVMAFVGVYPFGILVLRLGNWVRWHALNQVVALILIIVGSGLGFSISKTYNRTKKVNTAHQVIGILVFIFVLAQFTLGFLHHRAFKKTQQPTKLAPIHVWLGRVLVLMGVINGFLGFPLALAPSYNYVLAGLVLFIFPGVALLIMTKRFISKWWKNNKETPDEPNGYNMEAWRGGGEAQQMQGQPPAQPGVAYAGYGRQVPAADLGPQQNTREYV